MPAFKLCVCVLLNRSIQEQLSKNAGGAHVQNICMPTIWQNVVAVVVNVSVAAVSNLALVFFAPTFTPTSTREHPN